MIGGRKRRRSESFRAKNNPWQEGDSAMGEESKVPYVRVAEIEIDAAQLEHYGLRSHRPRLMPKLSASSM